MSVLIRDRGERLPVSLGTAVLQGVGVGCLGWQGWLLPLRRRGLRVARVFWLECSGGGGFHHRVGDKGGVPLIPRLVGCSALRFRHKVGVLTDDGAAGQMSTIGTPPSVQMGGRKLLKDRPSHCL